MTIKISRFQIIIRKPKPENISVLDVVFRNRHHAVGGGGILIIVVLVKPFQLPYIRAVNGVKTPNRHLLRNLILGKPVRFLLHILHKGQGRIRPVSGEYVPSRIVQIPRGVKLIPQGLKLLHENCKIFAAILFIGRLVGNLIHVGKNLCHSIFKRLGGNVQPAFRIRGILFVILSQFGNAGS